MSWLTEPDSAWDSPDPDDEPPRSRLRLVALLLGAWLAVSLIVLLVLLVVGGSRGNGNSPATTSSGSGAASAGSSSSAGALPSGWKQQAADDQTNCAAHAYGQVAAFFARTPCRSVHRLLATTSNNGRSIVIASNVVSFANEAQAKSYLTLVDADGTGNIADLLREGVRYPGGPAALPTTAAFASAQDGSSVHVSEAGYVTGTSSADDPTLQAVARQGI